MAGWLGSAWVDTAAAGGPRVVAATYAGDVASPSYVTPVAYTTGGSKRKLAWRPVRPTKAEVAQYRAQIEAPRRAPEPIPRGEQVDPFDDPFGDAAGVSQSAPPANLPGDQLLQKSEPPAKSPPALPGLLDAESSEQSQPIEVPSLEEALAAGPQAEAGECPSPEDLKRIEEITNDISPKQGRFPPECKLGKADFQPRAWVPTTFTWKASGLCHKPLYFEDAQLERYGHSWGPYLQPLASGAHFFLSVPALPYTMGLYPPGECMYSLGYYRPGNCAPYLLDPLPVSIRAALSAGGFYTGMAFLIP